LHCQRLSRRFWRPFLLFHAVLLRLPVGGGTMKLCRSRHGKNRCTLQEGHELPHTDAWDGASGVSWTDGEQPLAAERFVAMCEVCGGDGPYFWGGAGRLVCQACPEPSIPAESKLVAEVTVSGLDIVSRFFGVSAELVDVVGKLGAKHIYLDSYDGAPDSSARSYCSLCLRYGIGTLAIDHAESCLVGKAIRVVAKLQTQIAAASTSSNPSERTLANGSTAPSEQEGAAAEGPACAQQHPAALRVEYFVESPRNKFNPYRHPCQAITGGLVCELEHGHTGAHCSDGSVWADDGRRFA
jgi:hypothetical protein